MADAQAGQAQGSEEAVQTTADAKAKNPSKASQFGQRIGDVTSRVKEQGVLTT